MFHAMALKALGVRTAMALQADQAGPSAQLNEKIHDKSNRYSGVPAIPSDIGFHGGKSTGGKQSSGGIGSQVMSNPFVIIGMGLTTAALLGMMRRSFIGDRIGAQKYMQYRIMAQFFTVTALVAGVAVLGATYEPTNKHI